MVSLDEEDGMLVDHTACAAYLHKKVQELLCYPAELNSDAQDSLLSLVNSVFTDKDNIMFDALPTPEGVAESCFIFKLKCICMM